MLQMRENEISLRKLSGGIAQLRIVEGTLNSGFLSRFLNWFHELRSLEKNFQQSIIKKYKDWFHSRRLAFSQEKFSLRVPSMRKFHLDAIKHHR